MFGVTRSARGHASEDVRNTLFRRIPLKIVLALLTMTLVVICPLMAPAQPPAPLPAPTPTVTWLTPNSFTLENHVYTRMIDNLFHPRVKIGAPAGVDKSPGCNCYPCLCNKDGGDPAEPIDVPTITSRGTTYFQNADGVYRTPERYFEFELLGAPKYAIQTAAFITTTDGAVYFRQADGTYKRAADVPKNMAPPAPAAPSCPNGRCPKKVVGTAEPSPVVQE